ncbi:C4-dicarboxylate transport sensor protein dctB [Roseomonas mucosa]|uniref:C4-dicarboxylate transport sensor protein DctB n=1 Tax=Roseomonas mucosa TaxID=207340 RepID=A0A379N2A4_9PROT|nr:MULTISPECIES: ATP-binding protein [Roseomonas]MBS5902286.1 sensor histidine kinase [Acetobacteraceae bacterium]MCG7352713.1 ATP-binding protein [Roseomonas mucosa]MCG7358028.1 ATP-binding protein [Roseomonas mucosa]MDT8289532.1 ATP-binding protein [Roseomonas mucosa]MDT8293250.1 ATP-binding protein [Roseomonas mucosa]
MREALPGPARQPVRRRSRWHLRWRRIAWLLLPLLLLLLLDRVADGLATRIALSDLRTSARAEAELRMALLRSEIDKQRSLPVVLASDPDLRRALETRDPALLGALNAKLESLSGSTGAGVIYALDAQGMTLAASNWRQEDSFVGNDYSFRPYARLSMERGSAEHFALGTASHQPGLYLARRIDAPPFPGTAGPRTLGVIVVKTLFDRVEEGWRPLHQPVLVTDRAGVVLVTSEPAWRFRAIVPLPEEERRRIRESLQFGDAPLAPLPLPLPDAGSPGAEAPVRLRLPGAATESFLLTRVPVPSTDWTLHLLTPTRVPVELATAAARLLTLLAGLLALLLAWLTLRRRRRLGLDMARQRRQREELEAEVRLRTAELERANASLRAEGEERQRAEAAIHRLRDDLVQANKLAILGQITASVAHEINQPVAAIRSFADNARLFLERGDAASATRGLGTIAGLTERIGAITGGLRGFARKAGGSLESVPVRAAAEAALLLLGHRLRQDAVAVVLDVPEELCVRAERVRLEQVLVNLVQNAVEALDGRPGGRIRLEARRVPGPAPGRVRVTVSDNGPGLAPEVARSLFMPFTTTKSEGLGLGLVICRDIVSDFGGTLEAEPPCGPEPGGSLFVITLEQAA